MGREVLTGIALEAMTAPDLPEVHAIETASFKTPWSHGLFADELDKAVAISSVVRIKGRVAGYICSNVVLDEGHILNLAVHQDFRRKGIASYMLRALLETMKEQGCRSVFLEVRISNAEATAMYEKLGFEYLGTRKNYYTTPVEDAVLMVRRFTP